METQEILPSEETEGKSSSEDKGATKEEIKEKKPEPLFEMLSNPARVLPQQVRLIPR